MRLLVLMFACALGTAALAGETYRMGDQPIFQAAYDGDVGKLRELLDGGTAVDSKLGEYTPLTYAIDWGKGEAARLLLERGANVNRIGPDEDSPLIHAIYRAQVQPAGRLELVKLLLEHGADPNLAKGPQARTPLNYAFWLNDSAVYDAVKKAGGRFNDVGYDAPMMGAARAGNVDAVKRLLALGVGPDDENDGHGGTALWEAAHEGKIEVVQELLAAGARWKPDGQPISGSSTTWAAALVSGKPEVLAVFLSAGLDPKLKLAGGEPLVALAAANEDPAVISMLIEKGADPDAEGPELTPLMVAASRGLLGVVQRLIAAKVDLSRRDRAGLTAKVMAARENHADVVAALNAAGAVEYAGQKLPDSVPSAELADLEQTDVTGAAYEALPCLVPRLRFFVAAPPHSPGRVKQDRTLRPATLYAVKPPETALRVARPADLQALGLAVRLPSHALALARAIDSPWRLTGRGDLQLRFTGVPFVEFPEGAAWIIRPPPSQFGIVSPKIEVSATGFTIVRYGLAGEGAFTGRVDAAPRVVRVRETVSADGGYEHAEEPVTTPGLSIEPAYHAR